VSSGISRCITSLFICHLFNDAVSNSDYIPMIDWMLITVAVRSKA
jgi:hypothetical protein